MIEHVPLAIDFLQAAVSIVSGIGANQLAAVLAEHYATGVYQYAAAAPRT